MRKRLILNETVLRLFAKIEGMSITEVHRLAPYFKPNVVVQRVVIELMARYCAAFPDQSREQHLTNIADDLGFPYVTIYQVYYRDTSIRAGYFNDVLEAQSEAKKNK